MKHYICGSVLIILTILVTTILDHHLDHYYNNRINKFPKVYDISHKYLPNLIKYEYVSNLYTIFFVLIVLFIPKLFEPFVEYIIPIMLVRLIIMHMTVLPKNSNCIVHISSIFGGCYDKIFSGHFAVVFLITLLLLEYDYISLLSLILINVLSALLILATRSHYTIDIIVSLIITLLFYQNKIKLNI